MLDLMGDVLSCFYLLKQASLAYQKWNSFLGGKISRDELLQENDEAKFYWNKLKTTEFYVWSILPRVYANPKIIKNANLSPLETSF